MIVINKTMSTISGVEYSSIVVLIRDFYRTVSVVGTVDPQSPTSELDQLKSFYKEMATFEFCYYPTMDDAFLNRFKLPLGLKFPNLPTRYQFEMSLKDLDKQDASIYFDQKVIEFLKENGFLDEEISIVEV